MPPTITTQNNHIIFSNDDVEYWVSDTGQSASLRTITGQKELLLSAVSFAFAVQGDKVLSSQKVEYHPVDDREGRLKVLFQGAFLWLHCKAMPDHFQSHVE